jgi:hypothetical protein
MAKKTPKTKTARAPKVARVKAARPSAADDKVANVATAPAAPQRATMDSKTSTPVEDFGDARARRDFADRQTGKPAEQVISAPHGILTLGGNRAVNEQGVEVHSRTGVPLGPKSDGPLQANADAGKNQTAESVEAAATAAVVHHDENVGQPEGKALSTQKRGKAK